MRNQGSTPEEGNPEIAGFIEFGQDHIDMREIVKSIGSAFGENFFVSSRSKLIGGFGYILLFLTDQLFPGVPADVNCFAESFGVAATGSDGDVTDMN